MNDSLISVIVPVYNVSQYLSKCIESIIAQTYQNLEIILVDDGSTDNSGLICDEYSQVDSRIKVIHKKNGGLSDARNAGIDIAQGQYIGFVDSDDWIAHNMYEKLLNSIENTGADIAICEFFREYADKTIGHPSKSNVEYSKKEALGKLLENSEIFDHAWTKLYKKHLWNGINYPKGKYYEDILTTYKLFLKSEKIIYVRECLYHYRQRKGSIIRNGFNDVKFAYLDAVENFTHITELSMVYANAIELRILKVKYQLLWELFLFGDKKDHIKYRSVAKSWYQDIYSHREKILKAPGMSQMTKLFAKLSFIDYDVMRYLFKIKKISANNLKYYE